MIESVLPFFAPSLVCAIGAYSCFPYLINRSRTFLPQKNQGKWWQEKFVIVSGATDGIGKEYVRFLTQNSSLNVIAIGRNSEKLAKLQQQLSKNENKVIPIILDFNQNLHFERTVEEITSKILVQYQEKLQISETGKKDTPKIVGIINCCGTACFERFDRIKTGEIHEVNRVNINSLIFMVKFLTQNLKIDQKGVKVQIIDSEKLFFINVSSLTANFPQKYVSVYAATKSYQQSLLRSLQKQLKNQKIQFLNLSPWYIKTKMTNYISTWDTIKTQELVQNSFSLLAWKRSSGTGSTKHQFISWFYWIFRGKFDRRLEEMYEKSQRMKEIYNKRKRKE